MGSSLTLEAQYQNVNGLTPGNVVSINGMAVGRVNKTTLLSDSVRVSFTLDPFRDIPIDSKAKLVSSSILGEMGIEIVRGSQSTFLKDGQVISAQVEPGLIEQVTGQLTESDVMSNVTQITADLAALTAKLNSAVGDSQQNKLNGIMANLEATSQRTEALVAEFTKTAGAFTTLANSTNQVMETFQGQGENLASSLGNVKTLTDSLALASGNFDKLAKNLNESVVSLKEIMQQVNGTNGTLGKIINEKGLYESLDATLESVNGLVTSIQTNPVKYRKLVNLSVFPAKEKRSKEVKQLQNEYDAILLQQKIDSVAP